MNSDRKLLVYCALTLIGDLKNRGLIAGPYNVNLDRVRADIALMLATGLAMPERASMEALALAMMRTPKGEGEILQEEMPEDQIEPMRLLLAHAELVI